MKFLPNGRYVIHAVKMFLSCICSVSKYHNELTCIYREVCQVGSATCVCLEHRPLVRPWLWRFLHINNTECVWVVLTAQMEFHQRAQCQVRIRVSVPFTAQDGVYTITWPIIVSAVNENCMLYYNLQNSSWVLWVVMICLFVCTALVINIWLYCRDCYLPSKTGFGIKHVFIASIWTANGQHKQTMNQSKPGQLY